MIDIGTTTVVTALIDLVSGEEIAGASMINAQKHPEDYKDLIVRVAGYSDFFRNLDKPLQDEIIERTEQSFN